MSDGVGVKRLMAKSTPYHGSISDIPHHHLRDAVFTLTHNFAVLLSFRQEMTR